MISVYMILIFVLSLLIPTILVNLISITVYGRVARRRIKQLFWIRWTHWDTWFYGCAGSCFFVGFKNINYWMKHEIIGCFIIGSAFLILALLVSIDHLLQLKNKKHNLHKRASPEALC